MSKKTFEEVNDAENIKNDAENIKKGVEDIKYEDANAKPSQIRFLIILIVLSVILQTLLIIGGFNISDDPQDIISYYGITVNPQSDGGYIADYSIVWKPQDSEEPLTWVEIGMANSSFSVVDFSGDIESYDITKINCVSFNLNGSYYKGNTVSLKFSIKQNRMLCLKDGKYFYEFVPGWFNSIPIENYKIMWNGENVIKANNTSAEGNYLVWTGSLKAGGYVKTQITYNSGAFDNGVNTVSYQSFNDSGCHNDLKGGKGLIIFLIFAGILIIVNLFLIDTIVSYYRGRGFMSSSGIYMHTRGIRNPAYIALMAERNKNSHYGGGGHGGGSCACACACACAGGGRAGCSQKDTFSTKNDFHVSENEKKAEISENKNNSEEDK